MGVERACDRGSSMRRCATERADFHYAHIRLRSHPHGRERERGSLSSGRPSRYIHTLQHSACVCVCMNRMSAEKVLLIKIEEPVRRDLYGAFIKIITAPARKATNIADKSWARGESRRCIFGALELHAICASERMNSIVAFIRNSRWSYTWKMWCVFLLEVYIPRAIAPLAFSRNYSAFFFVI